LDPQLVSQSAKCHFLRKICKSNKLSKSEIFGFAMCGTYLIFVAILLFILFFFAAKYTPVAVQHRTSRTIRSLPKLVDN
jgi:hypothetical protein